MTPVEMPKANENMTEATLESWLVKEGQSVQEKQSLCTIITDKATFEMPAPCAGTVRKIYGAERSMLPVGYIMCSIGAPVEEISAEYETRNKQILEAHRGATTAASPMQAGAAAVASAAGASVVRATPAARRLAKEAGVDLAEIAKALNLSGPVGEKDVKAFLEGKK
ncbi:MAG: E3 binding domain-containing protein [Planctomycetes bacterium]|nr:E3 binding domain-containing protein [Planctomycetota bacterium]